MRVLVIIPAFNEQDNIVNTVNNLKAAAPFADYVIINDCSTDNTAAVIKENGFTHINLPINLGIGGAVQTGYKYAAEKGYDIAVQMDGDGQHDPEYLKALIAPIINGECDMAIGSRFIDKKGFQSSALRRVGISWLCFVIRLCCGVKVSDATSGFRATNKALIKLYSGNYAKDYPEPEAIVTAARHGFKVGEVAVVMKEREGGVSSISSFKSIYYMLKVTVALFVARIAKK